jgi:predicted AlkP superfamily phosphohydrolase/phosphomutase
MDLIRPYVEQGYLSTLARLLQEGASGELEVELPPGTVPNWPTFATGKNPGKHGLIWWLQRDSDTGALRVIDSTPLAGQTLWDLASDAGLRVGVVNVPATFPPRPVRGVLISGLLTPPASAEFTYPGTLRSELEARVGTYRVFPQQPNVKGNEAAYLQDLHDTLERRAAAVRYLLQRDPWELFVVVLSATDWVQHAFWKYQDPSHPRYDAMAGEAFSEAILSIYQHCDRVIASLLELIDEDTTVILMSDHGAGPAVGKAMINNWLLDMGLLRLRRQAITQFKYLLFRLGFTMENVYPWAARLGLMRYKRQLDPRKSGGKGLLRRIFLSYEDVDWRKSHAYTFGGMGQVYINSQSRGALGCVEEADYEDVRNTLITRLSQVKLPGFTSGPGHHYHVGETDPRGPGPGRSAHP